MSKGKNIVPLLIVLAVFLIILNLALFGFFDLSEEPAEQERTTTTGKTILTGESEKQKEISYYIDPLPYGVDRKYLNSVREGISYWETRENIIFRETSSELSADIVVQWVKEFGGEHLGYAYGDNFIEIGIGDSFCLEKWRPYEYESVLKIATHEFGHVIGKSHSNNLKDIMYYEISTKYEIDIEETEVLPDGWSRFYPTCTREDVAEYLFEVTSDEKLNVYIVPSIEEFNKLMDGEEFNHYIDCSEEKTTSYRERCIINSGGGIILENPSFFELGLGSDTSFTVTIKEL